MEYKVHLRKPNMKKGRIYMSIVVCNIKGQQNTTSDINEVTCRKCLIKLQLTT